MIKLHKKKNVHNSYKKVKKKTVSSWGILSVKNKKKNYFQITDVVEKPKIKRGKIKLCHYWKIYFTKKNNE